MKLKYMKNIQNSVTLVEFKMVAPIWKEWFILVSLGVEHVSTGFILAFPAVLTPSITSNSSDVYATREQASWITASYGMTGSIGFIVLPALMQLYGRRFVVVTWNLLVIIGSITIALGTDFTSLMVGRSIQGFTFCGMFLSGIIAGEYCHPKRRGISTAIKTLAIQTGVTLCHILGFILTWRQIAWLIIIPPVFGILSVLTWAESPYWLAYKGRFEESQTAFEWVRGTDSESKKEAKELIFVQRELRKSKVKRNAVAEIIHAFRSKEFLKPLFIAATLSIILQASGVHVMMAYLIEIMVQLTRSSSNAFNYIIYFDFMKIVACMLTIFIVQFIRRRTLLFGSGFATALLLSFACIAHYLNSKELLIPAWLTPSILILYNCVGNAGLIPLIIVIKGEIFPLQYKGIGSCATGIVNSLIHMITMKVTSNLLTDLKLHGTFAIFVIILVALLICLYFTLPETKDRTLQNIENEFIDFKLPNSDEHEADINISISKLLINSNRSCSEA